MMSGRTVVLKYCPYGKLFVEGEEERMVISRHRVMKEIGRLLDEAGKGEVEIRLLTGSSAGDTAENNEF